MKTEENKSQKDQQKENENTGKVAGTIGGALTGMSVGGAIIPVIGAIPGAIVGGVIGSEFGKKIGGSLLNKFGGRGNTQNNSAEKTDVTAELERLAKLHKQGVLDDEEFKAAKAALLNL
ncbi:hypothetical protein BH20ACI4_BH20ACI4_19940 [soil metagenome]